MTRIVTPAIAEASGATAEVYAQIKRAAGVVPNTFATIGAHSPNALKAVLAADGAVTSLSKQDQEIIKLLVSEIAGCDYCVAAHYMLGKIVGLTPESMRKIRRFETIGDVKHDALVRFVRLLQQTSGTIPQPEFDAVKTVGYTDEQIVEISLVIAVTTFTNVFNRINDTSIDFPAAI
ncbi:carboxymuconolactone decarboxylase family protein [Duganella callida]|uniref:Carboxymuconolactone decarboxylase family protein n=1 Tax=Duganella callida TaxID=2561932 RepID=A0A4Y9SAJ5_9BURK|nr:carboxymuconolactone decarboxylase family protein [Duganella callida]TFW18659.1 carboxymuconolactone decarboxylase family protein [Duganella callida]